MEDQLYCIRLLCLGGKSEWNMLYVIHTWIRNSKNVYDVNLDVFSMLVLLIVQGSSRVSGLFIYVYGGSGESVQQPLSVISKVDGGHKRA
mmetsp:Transcript_14818/g.25947  ORF Transcript_14818/g.25947 Transcript_14818/m.25947 type:complete len:90 (+) Transcript_14818:274-543(+)